MSVPSFKRRTIFSPTQISGCQLWLDAADSNTLTLSGSSVTAWNDKSGNNYHMNTLTPSARWTGSAAYPTIGTSINGLQTVNFVAQSGLKQGTTLDGVKNLFWVGRIAAPVGSGDVSYILLGHDTNYDWHSNQYGGKFVHVSLTQSGIYNASPTSLFTSDVNAIRDATFSSVNMPTAPNVSLLSVAGITGTTRYQGICYDRGDNLGWCGDLAEVIIFSTALSVSDRQTVEGYLAQKWGLTGSLPPFHAGLKSKIFPSLPQNRILNPSISVFSPTSITGCSIWLDGNDPAGTGVKPSNGATVSTWIDKSGSGTNLTAVGTPTYTSSNSSIYLNGGSYLQNTNFNFTTHTLFIVSVQASDQGPLYTNSTTTSGYSGFFPRFSNGSYYLVRANNDWISAGSPFSNGTTYLYSIQYDSLNNINLWSNGSISATISGTAGTITRDKFLLGKRNADGFQENMTGNIFEVIQYNTVLTTTQRQQVEGYLSHKWGIQSNLPVSHLHKAASPASIITSLLTSRSLITFKRPPGLYSFTSFTFTNAGATFQSGPTLSQCRTAYAGTSWLSQYFSMTTTGYQLWTVPDTQRYVVICAGAATYSPTNGFGYGVVTLTVVSLTRGQSVQILVGQMGDIYPGYSSAGGGGSFLASGTTPLTGECIVAAGGGGGFFIVSTTGVSNQNGTTNTTGNTSSVPGGSGGNGGSGINPYTQGGAGFIGNGGVPSNNSYSVPLSFRNGGTGGAMATRYYGGFGGGGGIFSNTGGGGGGGYSGGGAGAGIYGGGGGSFPSSSSLVGYNKGQGFVVIDSNIYSSIPSGGSISISSMSLSGATLVVSSPIDSQVYIYYITTSGSSISSPLYFDFSFSSNTFNISLTITPGTTYYAAIVGINNMGSSSPIFSSAFVFPGTISSVTLSDLSSTGGTLTWTTSSLGTGYNWYVGTGYGTGVIASGSTALLTTSFTYNLTNSYYYGWVQPTSTNGTILGLITYSINVYYTSASGTLYDFTSFTFTNAGATFRFGPTLAQCQSAYTGTSWLSQYFTMTTQGYQLWTVPATGTYTVICGGASSAAATSVTGVLSFGYGAIIRTTLTLSVGQQIQILVGQMGQAQYISGGLSSSGGGGGTFIASGTTPSGANCLVAAGGGGGWSSRGVDSNANASLTTSGRRSIDGILGGSNGNGGAVSENWSHSGAGFFGNGKFSVLSYVVTPSLSFINGGTGGTDSYGGFVGSFGGGGVRNTGNGGGGGGGGYSGGGGSYSSAGGGGSFPSNATFMGYNQGQGFVDIYSGTFSAVPTGGSVSITSFSLTQISFSISPATNVVLYDYYITSSASSIENPIYSGTTKVTSMTIIVNLQKNITYYVAIVPKNPFGSGTAVFSNGYIFPGDTAVGFTSMSTSGFILSWTTSIDAVSYAWSVRTGVSGGGTLVSSGTTSSLTSGAVSVSLSAGTNYYGYVIPSSSSSTGSTYSTGGIQISGRADFTHVGYLQAYTVPSGVSSVTVTLRAGGGGGGGYASGAAGAYVNGTMAVTAGQTYYIIVGGGGFGSSGSGTQSIINAFGGGGIATPGCIYGGGGGGRSAIQNPLGTDYVNAGGGGGCGYGAGGAGGAVGTAGISLAGGSAGAGGTLDGGPSYQGGDGTGSANGNIGGGGGGGGYRGGSGSASGTVSGRGGGGGGSSLTSNLTNVTVTTGGGGSAGGNYQQGGNGSILIVV